MTQRHSWQPASRDGGASAIPWVEFYDADGMLIDAGGRTPGCEPGERGKLAA